jgi:uncharacterized protein (DUF433 family)
MPTQRNEVITKSLDILGGTPVFRGTRVPFQALLDYLEGGQTLDAFLEDFPTVTRETAVHALEHAKSLVVSQLSRNCCSTNVFPRMISLEIP